jgi:Domain of unknown function (DUF4328)
MLRENSQRAKNTILVFWVLLGLIVVTIASTYMEYNLLSKMSRGDFTMDEAEANDRRQQIIAVIRLGVYIAAIIVFIMWFRRAYFNLREYFNLKEVNGMAAGAWFIPFMNLWVPFRMMKEIWNYTQAKSTEGDAQPKYESTVIVGWWWFFWITGNIIGNIVARRIFDKDAGVQEAMNLDMITIISDIFDVVALVLIIIIVKKVSVFEERMKQNIDIQNLAKDEPVQTYQE